jgi:hypothetical protein
MEEEEWWVKKANPSTNQLHFAEYTPLHKLVKMDKRANDKLVRSPRENRGE